jgi:hypothetical protein
MMSVSLRTVKDGAAAPSATLAANKTNTWSDNWSAVQSSLAIDNWPALVACTADYTHI